MPIYIWTFAVALVVALLVTPLVILLAKKTGAMDAPDARKVHKKPIPRIGGLAIYAGFMTAIIFVAVKFGFDAESIKETVGLTLSGSLIVAVGLIDDYKNLPAKKMATVMFWRFWLDYAAALHLLLTGKPKNAWAVVQARWDFMVLRHSENFINKRKENLQKAVISYPGSISDRSILMDYYLRLA